jgi:tryptophanyl-tRNA synthetase
MSSNRITGFKPTGHPQLGNYFGAMRPIIDGQYKTNTIAFVADLHAMTVEHEPRHLRERSFEVAALLLAAGLDPETTTLYLQSHVRAHTDLHYLLECATRYGEAHRMIQFKEKRESDGGDGIRLSLLTYPVLMAADILLFDVEEVPVGDDQSQHLELTRDVATRFNVHYGQTFVVPKAVVPTVAARLGDLAEPTKKMGKTNASPAGVLFLLDEPEVLRRKVMRAVTDAETEVRYAPLEKPGVSNLLDILAACTGGDPVDLATGYSNGYGALKRDVADAVIGILQPMQERYAELAADRTVVNRILANGAARASEHADATVRRAREAMGLGGF